MCIKTIMEQGKAERDKMYSVILKMGFEIINPCSSLLHSAHIMVGCFHLT